MNTPDLLGVHHLKLAVSDLGASLAFYQAAFDARRIPTADHRHESDGSIYAYILEVPGLGTLLELRLNPARATAHSGFDPITVTVADRIALGQWDAFLSERGILHSPVITAIQAWLLVVQDPDGNRLRLYTRETHGPELKPDEGNAWLDV